jgi:hypothetical protein
MDLVILKYIFPMIWDLKKLWILSLCNALDHGHYQNQACLALPSPIMHKLSFLGLLKILRNRCLPCQECEWSSHGTVASLFNIMKNSKILLLLLLLLLKITDNLFFLGTFCSPRSLGTKLDGDKNNNLRGDPSRPNTYVGLYYCLPHST